MNYSKSLITVFIAGSLLACSTLASASASQSLGSVAANITSSMNNVAKLITAVSYVAGIGFALMGLLKLKAHKDQPAQVALSQPLVLILIAAGLIFLPSLINTTGQTLWDGNQVVANARGEGLSAVSGF